jgi:hypothetical protein
MVKKQMNSRRSPVCYGKCEVIIVDFREMTGLLSAAVTRTEEFGVSSS